MPDDESLRAFITPPPGLLPDAPPRDELEGTDSGTRRVSREGPVFFARPPGSLPAHPDEDAAPDSTVTAPPPTPHTPTWSVQTSDGRAHPIPVAGLVVGRNPSVPDGWEGATLLGVLDPEKSVSKTHAALRIEGGELTVIDLASTNGTTVAAPDGTVATVDGELAVTVAPGSTIGLGSYPVRVVRS